MNLFQRTWHQYMGTKPADRFLNHVRKHHHPVFKLFSLKPQNVDSFILGYILLFFYVLSHSFITISSSYVKSLSIVVYRKINQIGGFTRNEGALDKTSYSLASYRPRDKTLKYCMGVVKHRV